MKHFSNQVGISEAPRPKKSWDWSVSSVSLLLSKRGREPSLSKPSSDVCEKLYNILQHLEELDLLKLDTEKGWVAQPELEIYQKSQKYSLKLNDIMI